MEISGMLIWAMVLVSLIVFIVLLVKAFKSWGVAHTILLSILFIECWTFLFFAGGVAHYRIALTKTHDTLAEKVEKLLIAVDMEMYGDRLEPKLNLEKFAPLTNELNRLTLERGRVWRGAVLQRVNPASGKTPPTALLQLPMQVSNLPVAAPAGAAGAAGADAVAAAPIVETGLAVDSVVYLFGEREQPVGLIPEVFLGEFIVKESKELMLTVAPTTPLTKEQETAMSGNPSWAIYELMPLDSHIAFARPGSTSEETAIFGVMDKDDLLKDFEGAFRNALPPLSEASKTKILQKYANDGSAATIETPPEALGYQVKFSKDYTDVVDAKGGRSPLEGGYHDTEGNMIDQRLKREAAAESVFKVGDSYVLDAPTANKLQLEGIVEQGAPVYLRPLIDYSFANRETRRMIIRAKQDTDLITREYNEAVRSTTVTLDQELKHEEEGMKLKQDKAQYEKELEVIAGVLVDLEGQVAAKKAELSQVYASIISLHDSLVKHQRDLANLSNVAQ
jgi:hypothetical protein